MAHVEQDGFVPASPNSEWYVNLEYYGSCLRLYDLLAERRELIHKLGPEGITALHKGVEHGCVKLVRFILVDMFGNVDGHCTCGLQGADSPCPLTREGLLRKSDEYGSTAVNMAVVSGSPKMVLLLKWAIESNSDKNGALNEKKLEGSRRWELYWESLSVNDTRSSYHKEKAAQHVRDINETEEHVRDINETEEHVRDINETEEHVRDINETEQPIAPVPAPVPDVKDDAIYKEVYGEGLSTRILEVYKLMEEILNKDWGGLQEDMDMLKASCKKNVDFEFVPIAHIFLHFLLCIFNVRDIIKDLSKKIFESIILVCKEHDYEEATTNSESLVLALFQSLDPRGRTILHLYHDINSSNVLWSEIGNLEQSPTMISSTIMKECMNVRDGAGRTILHNACIHGGPWDEWSIKYIDWDVTLAPPYLSDKFYALVEWCFPLTSIYLPKNFGNPILLAILFDTRSLFEEKSVLRSNLECFSRVVNELHEVYPLDDKSSFSIAAFLGRASIVEKILEHYFNFKGIHDSGLGKESGSYGWPAIHSAALSGQVETLQTILKYPIYDPICQHNYFGTALHFLLNPPAYEALLKYVFDDYKTIALLHVLPNSNPYRRIRDDFLKHEIDDGAPRMFTSNEVSCINLLLQAGIDLWTPHCRTGEHPNPGPQANNDARKWWFDKVVNEVVTQKASITSAANATSVVAALVATTSFIGPLQPPLSYSGDGGFIDTTRSSVRVYLVCNSLSFFFSIASILMALLPAIPMPKESMYDELVRSRRSLKASSVTLLISIICTLISFSSASMAVVSSEWRNWHLVVIVFGGVICAAVLVVYVIRLLRMVYHKNDRFRRLFAKYMYF